jgi:DNA repair protein RadA/Sms
MRLPEDGQVKIGSLFTKEGYMARTKTRWVCQECGFNSTRSLGRCTECGTWGSLVEEMEQDTSSMPLRARAAASAKATGFGGGGGASSGPQPLHEIETSEQERLKTGLASVDEVLGGGLVPGSVVLLAGDPGVGKSTFLLQAAHVIAQHARVLYVSGEESKKQVCLRAQRLGMNSPNILIDSEQNIVAIQKSIEENDIEFVVIDSVQAVYHPEITSAPGSVSQVRESAGALVTAAKAKNVCMVIVGHVTKDGTIAGPRVLEHMVDVVLHFEGDRTRQLRILRANKNRFGSTHEIALFTMSEDGLNEVDNASALFLSERLSKRPGERAPSGTAVLASAEGNRSLLLEVQSLVAPSANANGNGRRVANGCDVNRLMQILAVLEKRVGLLLARQDVYVNIVGGFQFDDPAGDLALSIAVATSSLDRSVDPLLVTIGEIGLSGEIRPVSQLERRLREAARMGFRKAVVPAANLPISGKFDQLEVVGVEYLVEALTAVMPGLDLSGRQRVLASGHDKNRDAEIPHSERSFDPSIGLVT